MTIPGDQAQLKNIFLINFFMLFQTAAMMLKSSILIVLAVGINITLVSGKSARMFTHGLLNRWTLQYDWGITTGGLERLENILQVSHHISIKISVSTSMRVTTLRAWSILALAMS